MSEWTLGLVLLPGGTRDSAPSMLGAVFAGTEGAVLVRRGTGVLPAIRSGPDLPASATALAGEAESLWISTRRGSVRTRIAQ